MAQPQITTFDVSAGARANTDIQAVTVSSGGLVSLNDSKGTPVASIQVGKRGDTYSAEFSPAGGSPINVNFTLAEGADGSISANGKYGAVPFQFQLSSDGKLLGGNFPKPAGADSVFFQSLARFNLQDVLKPSPTHPEEPRDPLLKDKLKGGTGLHGGPGPVAGPAFNGRCAGAVVLFGLAAFFSEGVSAIAGAAWLTGECHNWSFKVEV
jgi:hypothetical protein